MSLKAEIKVDDTRLRLMAEKAIPPALFAVSRQALSDCNFYCKSDTGDLISSSIEHSELDKGILRWVMPYAEYQYTAPAADHDCNPNAVPEWCEKAYEMHHDEWERIFSKTYGEELLK